MIGGMVMVGGIILSKSPVNLAQVTPIARLTSEWEVIVVPANSPHKTMADLVKAFKENPGKVSWGGGSAGGTDHILVGLIAKEVGGDPAKINYVPFKGGGEAIAAILGGHVTAGVSGIGEFAEQIKAGKMRALALSAPKTVDGIPSLKEQGINVELGNWRGIFGAPGITPQQRDALVKLVRDRDRDAGVESRRSRSSAGRRGSSAATSTRRSSTRTPSASPPSSSRSG